ncbi:MAG: efflux RND transporter periplasmic adaptor subunit [Bacteroidetes bacterium]|nr:efflux RND transporter periplasmic adaptor subunit [Bacteroidota bacterium]
MNQKTLIRVLALLVMAGLLVWFVLPRKKQAGKADIAQQQRGTALPVTAYIARVMPVNDVVVATGTVMPDEMVELASEVPGRIVGIHFTEGQPVKKGQLLVSLNNADLLAQQERNMHQLRLAEERERRQKVLLESEGISQQAYEQTLTELNSLKAEASLLQAQLDKTLIKAPFDGLAGLRLLSEGAYVSPGTRLVKIVRTRPVKIDFSVPERYAQYVRTGTPVQFTVEGNEKVFSASVYATESMVDQRNRSLMARARFANPNGEVLPGMFARVELSANGLVEALQIPARAIIPEMGTSKVFVYRNGKAYPEVIVPGLRTASKVQVLSGLNENDTVITSGLLQLRPGMDVQLKSVEQP